MKTVYINGSPKTKFSASAYFGDIQKFFTGGKSEKHKLRTVSDGDKILQSMENGDAVVFALPLYVDGVPSHVLGFMKNMEKHCKENKLQITVYVFANNGFIEGCQNEPLMQVFENFCNRSGIIWGGGIGAGGGVMLNVMRIVFGIYIGILFLNIVLSVIQTGNFLPKEAFVNFAGQAAITLFLNAGVFFYAVQMGAAIRKRSIFGKKYTRVMLPSLCFIIASDIFFFIISFFQGGMFRGWLAKKTICNQNESDFKDAAD